MSTEPENADDIQKKLGLLLDSLGKIDFGPARIANLVDGLRAKHIRTEHIKALANSLPSGPLDPKSFYADTFDLIGHLSESIFFQRPSPPDCNLPVALVIPLPLFDEGSGFHLFSDDYIFRAKETRVSPDPMESLTDADPLVDLLGYLREGLSSGIAKGLGANGRVVFVTPVDDNWTQLTAGRFLKDDSHYTDPGPANLVCDYLGLPHRNVWLVELRSKVSLQKLIELGSLTLAAPTVIEAWSHDYFRHWPRGLEADCWGRTLRISDDFSPGGMLEGRPEAIINRLPTNLLSTHFDVAILGRVTARTLPGPRAVCDCLTESRELATLIEDVVMTVMSPGS